jgi:small subunit ribosomal protein S2
MSRLPAALFVVDIKAEHIAIKEAQKLNIPVFAMVDTNSDPREVDYVIPSNDDASKSIDKILTLVTNAVIEGNNNRTSDKDGDQPTEDKSEKSVAKVAPAKAEKEETPAPVAAAETVTAEPTTEEVKTEDVKTEE